MSVSGCEVGVCFLWVSVSVLSVSHWVCISQCVGQACVSVYPSVHEVPGSL